MFQQDNVRSHRARVTMNIVTQDNINALSWPSNSPYLNSIEHIWDGLDRSVRYRHHPHQSLDQFSEALQHEWQRIPHARIQNLIRSIPRRYRTVLAAHAYDSHNRH